MNRHRLLRNSVALIAGFVFSLGLALGGMTLPQKVIGFLNPWDWDPALLFVMLGAIGIHALAYPVIRKRASPLFDTNWHVPQRKDISPRLILGAALFGVGWGLGGYCPGPSLTALPSGDARAFFFVGAMLLGMVAFRKTEPYLKLRE